MTRQERLLVTGGSGFIGTNLVEHFINQDCQVVNLDIAPPRNPVHRPFWQKVDILDREKLIETVRKVSPQYVLHFAARTDLKERNNLAGYTANIEGIFNLIDAIKSTPSVQRVVFASSQLVCKLGHTPIHELDYCPDTLYGLSKALGERIVRTADEFGAAWCIVRPTSLWGPWFDVPYKNFFSAIARNIYFHPSGVRTLKQWGFVLNSVYQVQKLLEAPQAAIQKKVFYLADFEPLELRKFADMVQQIFGSKSIRTLPIGLLKLAARAGDMLQYLGWRNPPLTSFRLQNIVTDELCDTTGLQSIVGKLPYTVEQGIKITVDWMRNNQ